MIRLRGATEHNLDGIDLDLPLGRWIAVTGPSGSGKTSLVFDTLVKEGERRFLGSLSPRARHFFGKLGRSDVRSLKGLPATIAVGQQGASSSPRSTVGTLTGTLDLLRLVFARAADGSGLTRSHFSFNHPLGQCPACRGLGLEDRVDPAKIIADPTKSLRDGALVPTLKNGYTVYSQVTLAVMNQICQAHGFDVDTPWQALSEEQHRVILYGTRALKVPFGKHAIESRMKWAGITARPREEGYYPGLMPVIEETLKRNRNTNILRFVTSGPCSACDGTRLDKPGREARFGKLSLPDLLAIPVAHLGESLSQLPTHPVWKRVRPGLDARAQRLVRLGLGHLSLNRVSTSLSGGEAQRVRLAAQLGAELTGVLFALDEPTLGLHPESHAGMAAVLDELIDKGNSLIVVEHDPDMVRRADHVVALGPGAGSAGGRIVATDLPGHAASSARQPYPLGPLGGPATPKASKRAGSGSLTLTGATLHNLQSADLELSLGTFHVIMGPSGAGKSSLLFGTLLPALSGTGGGPFNSLTFDDSRHRHAGTQAVDARPIGKTPRSTPATWCGLFDLVRKRFGKLAEAKTLGLTASHFSFNSGRGRCTTCDGLGVTRLGLHLFEDVELVCDTCGGSRYDDSVLAPKLRGKTIADVLAMTFREAREFFADDAEPAALCEAMLKLGLGYLPLGQSSGSLSRGESQRIKLGTLLGAKRKEKALILLDEPDRGLAPSDVAALLQALDALVEVGHTIVAISHHRHVWAAADRLIEVRDGRTDHAPEVDWSACSKRRPERDAQEAREAPPRPVELQGVTTHNLKGIDVRFPHGKLTAVCGLSGSGKSSLVFDTLSAAAQARFAESLPFQVRRFLRRLPQPELIRASGLTPTLNLRQSAGPGPRSTVATLSECGPLLRLIFARAGIRRGQACGLSASHFSRDRALGACPACAGRGTLGRCDPARLVTHSGLPLFPSNEKTTKPGSAMSGTRPGRFFTEPDGQHMATLLAALSDQDDALTLLAESPWRELPTAVQRVVLRGTGSTRYAVKWEFPSKAEGEGRHDFEATWDGLAALVEREAKSRARSKKAAEWRAPLSDAACPTCSGSGLAQAAMETTVLGQTLVDLEQLPLTEVLPALEGEEAIPTSEAALRALLPELSERVSELTSLGLGHLNLGRSAVTLSNGELQRVRLASVLRSGLSGTTLVLDEPTSGLHERDVRALMARLQRFQADGNTVVIVSHRASVWRAADHLIELGPGAGADGGELLAEGPPSEVLRGDTPAAVAVRETLAPAPPRPLDTSFIHIEGAHAHNLKGLDIKLPASGLVCFTGVSGSGKSSLAFDVLGASVQRQAAIDCDKIEIPGGFARFAAIHDARPRSGSSAGTALSALDLAGEVAALFDNSSIQKRAFRPRDASGRCPACRGTGRERVAMDFLADLDLPCQTCNGRRFRPEVLAVTWRGKSIADLLDEPASALLAALDGTREGKLHTALSTLEEVAAGHIPLGRPRSELSGGESARVGLAASLIHATSPALYLFDEPSTGLHEADLQRLIPAFRRLADRGDLVVATEHRPSIIAAADWVIELGPEGGPGGGRLLSAGAPRRSHSAQSPTT